MVEKIVRVICNRMITEGIIEINQKDDYIYALITITEKIITVGTIVTIGVLFDIITPTILFLLFFLLLRKRTGGYHAEKFWQCYLLTNSTYLIVIFIAPFLKEFNLLMHSLLFVSLCVIALIGTVNHPNMQMDNQEIRASKKAARVLAAAEYFSIYFLKKIGVEVIILNYTIIAMILCALLLCIAKILKQEVVEIEEKSIANS